MIRTQPMIIAHRGFSGRFPENTLRAFREALKLPVDAIEFDVRKASDGTLIVIHDETVDRTTSGTGRVGDITWDEIRKLDAGAWKSEEFAGERIPSLDEVLEAIGGQIMLVVEIKEPGTEQQIIETLHRHNALERANLVSFHAEAIAKAKQIAPQVPYTLIGGINAGLSDRAFFDFTQTALRNGANAVTAHYSILTRERIKYCHNRHLFVGTWTVDNKDLASILIAMGVDEIATDYPDVVLAALTG